MPGLIIRKLADKTVERAATVYPDGRVEAEPWPLAGIRLDAAPGETIVSTTVVATGRREGWLTVEGEQVVHRPGGPPDNLWAVTHTFAHADALVFHTVDGDVRYRVTHQPDKYADPGDDQTPVTDDAYAAGQTRVDWFYGIELEA